MAATRKRKSTRTPTKSKKAKAEEEASAEEPVEEEETPKEEDDADPPADDDRAGDKGAVAEEESKAFVQSDSKDTHEAAAALLAVSGGEPKAVAAENGESAKNDPNAQAQPASLAQYDKNDVDQKDTTASTKEENSAKPTEVSNKENRDDAKEEAVDATPTNGPSAPATDASPEVKAADAASSNPASVETAASNVINENHSTSSNPGVAVTTPAVQQGVPSAYTTPVPVSVPAPATSTEAIIEERGEVSMLYVGRVIGKGGEMIRDLQARSGCRIDVDQNVPDGAPRIITYKGTRSTIDFAKQLVSILCTEGGNEADLPLGQAIKKLVLVPAAVIGKVIGRGGEMIRELQSKSSAKIQVDHNASGEMRHINVTGTEQSVLKAEEMIAFLSANPAVDAHEAIAMLIRDKATTGAPWGSGPPYPNLPNNGQGMPASNDMGGGMYGGGVGGYAQQQQPYGGGYVAQQASPYGQQFPTGVAGIITEMFPCEKMYMGRVIGQKGVTINDLQKRSGCDIQINQNVPMGQPCEICIKGSMQGIQMAKQMLQEIIEMGPNHPYAGGHGQQGGRGHYGGQPVGYQQQPYQGGYANQGYQPQSYPAQQQYGMQQQPYGGQPMYQQQQYQPQPPMYAQPGMPLPPAQASPWRSATAADGQIYYYNQHTGETQWDKPPGMP
eukprot:CCRYP_005184-RD/>CCRYP_005184-RD protein AED:0.15 eAED:0.15 QI:597/1/1/1/0.5/0.4/5/212/668